MAVGPLFNLAHGRNRQQRDEQEFDVMLAYHLAQTQSVDDGSTDGELNLDNPLVFNTMLQAMNNKEDILTQGQMLKLEDESEKRKFLDAQVPEIDGLEEMQCFSYHRLSSLPKGTKLLRAVWSYRRKRRPDGMILKYKARLCATQGPTSPLPFTNVQSFVTTQNYSTRRQSNTLAST